MEQPRGGHETPGPAAEAVIAEARAAAARAASSDTLARDSAGQVKPRYLFVPRPAGALACGELVVEPVLGPVRVAAVLSPEPMGGGSALVQVAWSDEDGPCRAAGRYPADQPFMVRVPDYADRLLVRRGVDQAARGGREISGGTARLIAAHAHLGPRSALYRFAVSGAVPEQVFDELNQISTSQPAYRSWVSALVRFCLAREEPGPVTGWGPDPPLPASLTAPALGTRPGEHQPRGRTNAAVRPLNSKRLATETALQLMEAAYALGTAASRSTVSAANARWLVRAHAIGGP